MKLRNLKYFKIWARATEYYYSTTIWTSYLELCFIQNIAWTHVSMECWLVSEMREECLKKRLREANHISSPEIWRLYSYCLPFINCTSRFRSLSQTPQRSFQENQNVFAISRGYRAITNTNVTHPHSPRRWIFGSLSISRTSARKCGHEQCRSHNKSELVKLVLTL